MKHSEPILSKKPLDRLTEADVVPLVLDASKLDLARLVLQGYDEEALYSQFGPAWRFCIPSASAVGIVSR